MLRHNFTLESYHMAMYRKEYFELLIQLQQLVEIPKLKNAQIRYKRNIFGDLISGFTGLATEKEIENERRERHDTDLKVKQIIRHELEVEHAVERITSEVKRVEGVVKVLASVEHENKLDTIYFSKKVRHMPKRKNFFQKMKTVLSNRTVFPKYWVVWWKKSMQGQPFLRRNVNEHGKSFCLLQKI